jgi:hypothetical protein
LFRLLKKLRSEAKTVGGLSSLDISSAEINQLLKSDLFKQTTKYGVDMRDDGEFISLILQFKATALEKLIY